MNKNSFSRIGFILAAAGSAVGLGNIWKFPYITGENGGGVFVMVYLLTVVFIGMSIFIAEVLLGSTANKDAVSTLETLAPEGKKYWKYTGFSFLTGVIILSFYSIVVGWILNYIVIAATSLPSIRLRIGAAGGIPISSITSLVTGLVSTSRASAAVRLSGTNGTSVCGRRCPSRT